MKLEIERLEAVGENLGVQLKVLEQQIRKIQYLSRDDENGLKQIREYLHYWGVTADLGKDVK